LNLERAKYVDLRSPVEYASSHIPGAVNIPLLSDEERSEIGTIYRHQGPDQAKIRGLEVVAPRLADMISEIKEFSRDNNLVVYCWRGGDRSRAVANLLDIMQVDGYRLIGGYKSYRAFVLNQLQILPRSQVVVIHGLTGTGKTEIIKHLAAMGMPALDLEGLANHRGSVFGGIGLGLQPSQKQFDSSLYQALDRLKDERFLIVESESKKIGRVFLPDHLFARMKEGRHVLVYDTLENRINRLVHEYVEDASNNTNDLLECVQGLKYHLGKGKTQQVVELIKSSQLTEAIKVLLTDYYDPLYGYPSAADIEYDLNLDGSDSEQAALALVSWLTTW